MAIQILEGDCRVVLAGLPAGSVDMICTSPPYYGLRDYGTGTWEGGDAGCGHVVGEMRRGMGLATSAVSVRGGGHKAAEVEDIQAKEVCPHCGARRIDSQIGLELTPEAYVAEIVVVMREARRVLKDTGTLWLNLGDSYARSDAKGGSGFGGKNQAYLGDNYARAHADIPPGLKAKDLIGIPWRVAFALQADGWYLRQDIIWHKPNPMPESVQDRCTKAHEYMFLLAKSGRYYFNAAAIAEPAIFAPGATHEVERAKGYYGGKGTEATRNDGPFKAIRETRNKRTVWTVATKPFGDSHFATFPPALIEPCILAGCPEGGTVLDPFGGAGTTGLVADRHQRNAILIELNPEYAAMARQRIAGDASLFSEVT